MGTNISKPARSAAGAAKRQYPKQAAPPPRVPKAPRESKLSPQQPPKATQPTAAPKPTPTPTPSIPKPAPIKPPVSSGQGPQYHSKEKASSEKSSAIDMDGRDPDFAASLRSLGPVDPTLGFPSANRTPGQTIFPSGPTSAWLVHTSRERATKQAEFEAGEIEMGLFRDRQFADAFAIQQFLHMRDVQKLPTAEIEKIMKLRAGLLDKLDPEVVSRIEA